METPNNAQNNPLETTFKILACYDKFKGKIDTLKEREKKLVNSKIDVLEKAKIEKVRAQIQQP